MNDDDIRRAIERVRTGTLPRRGFIAALALRGVPPALASLLLMDAGLAQTAAPYPPYAPTRRGGGGLLKLLMWQGPTVLNPHFAVGVKDQEGTSVFYEPLATFDPDGNLMPILAAEIPSRDNGGLPADGRSVLWRLKKGVTWHDGAPFTADDVVFNWQFATDPATASTFSGIWSRFKASKVDSHTVRYDFEQPTPLWFSSCALQLIPRHVFQAYTGARSREAPANLRPVGTGPYRFTEFRPGDLLRAEANPNYHLPNRPHFDALELKGGGDATSAARAVIQTGEYDWAWNLLVEDEILKRMESGGKGVVDVALGGTVEFIQLNCADPWTEVEGERSSPKSRHPVLSDPAVREALSLLVDRVAVQDFIFGRAGPMTTNILANPARYRSPHTRHQFDVERANAVLEAAGWRRGSGGTREKDGRRLKFVYQSSTNSARQKVQTVIKQACAKAGIDVEIKVVQGSVFFAGDGGNPDTNQRFQADLQQYAFSMGDPDPQRYMDQYHSREITGAHNKWQGRNVLRWRNAEYDRLHDAARGELDPVKRTAMFIRMNDLVVGDRHILPLVMRPLISGRARNLAAPLAGWGNNLAWLAHWHRTA
ncbi:MAG: peptide ABC transporter substrate-binding protein [Rubrivivax sp.]